MSTLPTLPTTKRSNVQEVSTEGAAETPKSLIQEIRDMVAKCVAEVLPEIEADDERLRRIVLQQDGKLSPADIAWAFQRGYKTDPHVSERETSIRRDGVARMKTIVQYEAVAGTAEDRKALAAAVDAASQELDTRGAQILEEITRLQSEYRSLEAKKRNAEQRAHEAEEAVGTLRESLHPLLKKTLDHIRVYLNESHRGPFMNGIDGRRKQLEAYTTCRHSQESILNICRQLPGSHYAHFNGTRPVPCDAWDQFLDECKKELAEIAPQCEESQAVLDAAYAELDAYRDYYVV